MNKKGFLEKLKSELNGYSPEEVDRSIAFYSEMIDDRIEDGADEEEAVASIGSIEEIVNQIKLELPLGTLIREKAKSVKFYGLNVENHNDSNPSFQPNIQIVGPKDVCDSLWEYSNGVCKEVYTE